MNTDFYQIKATSIQKNNTNTIFLFIETVDYKENILIKLIFTRISVILKRNHTNSLVIPKFTHGYRNLAFIAAQRTYFPIGYHRNWLFYSPKPTNLWSLGALLRIIFHRFQAVSFRTDLALL